MFCSFIVKLRLVEMGSDERIRKYVNFYQFTKILGELKNTTISNFLTKDKIFKSGGIYFLRFSCSSQKELSTLMSYLYEVKIFKERVSIQNKKFLILDIIHNEEKTKYAKQLLIEEVEEFRDLKKVKINFITPTLFKFGEHYIDEPEPYLYFLNSYKKLERYLAENGKPALKVKKSLFKLIEIEDSQIEKKDVFIQNRTYKGFIGKVTYSIPKIDGIGRIIDCLSQLSFFTGVGEFTKLGLGQIMIEEVEDVSTEE